MKNVKLLKECGLPISKPTLAVGEVIEIITHKFVVESKTLHPPGTDKIEYVDTVAISFIFDKGKAKGRRATQIFQSGDVYPQKIGDKMLGAVTHNQWGSIQFAGTHLVK